MAGAADKEARHPLLLLGWRKNEWVSAIGHLSEKTM
jgi:hypothetical protein